MAVDESENDYPSETESCNSEIADDLEPEFDAESERRILHLKTKIQPLLDNNRTLILYFLKNIDSFPGIFRRGPADGSSGSRRQGSPINGPPRKRRTVEHRRVLQLPDKDDNSESDGEEDPNQRRAKNKDPKLNGPSRSKMFACPFYQRDQSRYTNRACQWPGWAEFHRLK